MDRLERLKRVLKDNDLLGEQCFDCESLVGDHRETIYNEDGIQVLVCYYYEYVEILGLSDDEYAEPWDEDVTTDLDPYCLTVDVLGNGDIDIRWI